MVSRSFEPAIREESRLTRAGGLAETPSSRGSGEEATRSLYRVVQAIIDQSAADRPTFSEFLQRLEQAGVHAIPSVQSSGRFNGISYEMNDCRIKGSDLGRAYTAHGLQHRKG